MEAHANINLQAEKYLLIRRLAEVEDLSIIQKIKKLIDEANPVVGSHPSGRVLTQSELIARAQEANRNIENNEFTDLDDLKKESEDW